MLCYDLLCASYAQGVSASASQFLRLWQKRINYEQDGVR